MTGSSIDYQIACCDAAQERLAGRSPRVPASIERRARRGDASGAYVELLQRYGHPGGADVMEYLWTLADAP